MTVLENLIKAFKTGENMPTDKAPKVAEALASADVVGTLKKEFLEALAEKGETPAEVAAFAAAFRDLAVDPGVGMLAEKAIDIVGTGGDKSGSFNISSLAGIITASCGVPVMKHGNRSITSKSGSADFLASLGIATKAEKETIRKSLKELNFCFFFAPAYHPAFKEIAPVRKAMAAEGKRSIFNLLGPLINPGRPAYQLMGVFSQAWVPPMADALSRLGLKRGYVVHCALDEAHGMDELTCAGQNHVSGFGEFTGINQTWDAAGLGLPPCEVKDLEGGTAEENIELLRNIFEGKAPQGLVDTVALNAGCALYIAGAAENIPQGVKQAREALLDGTTKAWVTKAQEFYAGL